MNQPNTNQNNPNWAGTIPMYGGPQTPPAGQPPTGQIPPAQPQPPLLPGQSSPTAGNSSGTGSPYVFNQVLDAVNTRMQSMNGMNATRNALINSLYTSGGGLTPQQISTLDPQTQAILNSGNKNLQQMYLQSVNDQIQGYNSGLKNSMDFLSTGYQNQISDAETQKTNALNGLAKLGNTPQSIAALKEFYPQFSDFFDQLGTANSTASNSPGSGAQTVMTNLGITDPTMPLSQVVSNYGTDSIVNAIVANEGGSPTGVTNNPGNIKYTGLPGQTDSGIKATDGGTFANYSTPEDGRQAISKIVMNAAQGGSMAYGDNPTITSFMNTYTNTFGTPTSSTSNPNGSLYAATGLSPFAVMILTGQTRQVPAASRAAAQAEVQSWSERNGVDTSTFSAQNTALNDIVTKNLERANQTKIMANEVTGTADALMNVINTNQMGNIKQKNILDLALGKEVNKPWATEYGTQIQLMANDLAGYLAASRGATSPELQDQEDASKIIAQGMSTRSVQGFRDAIDANEQKTLGVVNQAVDDAQKSVWDLYGVGDKYQSKIAKTYTIDNAGDAPVGSTVVIGGKNYKKTGTDAYEPQ